MTNKVFTISLHKCGTSSIHTLTESFGLKSKHWPKVLGEYHFEEMVAGFVHDRIRVVEAMRPVFDRFQAVSDVPLPALYSELADAYPQAKFLLVTRDPVSWIRSVRNQTRRRALHPFEIMQYTRMAGHEVTDLTAVSDQQITAWFFKYHADVLQFFSAHPERLLFGSLADPDLAQRIADFLEVEGQFTMPHKHKWSER